MWPVKEKLPNYKKITEEAKGASDHVLWLL